MTGNTGPAPKEGTLTEFGLIARIREAAERRIGLRDRVSVGIGDDCAVLRFTPGREVLVTTDMLMDGRHFRTEEHDFEAIGSKAMIVNLSDIAAMAGVPIAAVVAVALPRGLGAKGLARAAERLHAGMLDQAERWDVALVGGDTNAWDGPLVISVTLLGEATERGPVRRSGARPGDRILVTGPLGGSLRGRHMRSCPRIHEALAIHGAVPIHAMIDISDGLGADLGHILAESGGLGAVLDADTIPIAADAHELARVDGRSALVHALEDGEDFELCLTLDRDDSVRILSEPLPGVTLHAVGEVTREPGLRLRHGDGRTEAIRPVGFDHLAGL